MTGKLEEAPAAEADVDSGAGRITDAGMGLGADGAADAGIKLSRRLAALAEWVPQGARLADIGTDHALLPVYLAAAGQIGFAVAGDVHAGPVEAAKRQVAAAGLTDKISVRHGDGLSVLTAGEVDTVCIAGMGGGLIVRLLEAAGERLDGVHTLVLSPHGAEDAVRSWLIGERFVLDRERLLEEDGIIYTLLRAVRADGSADAAERTRVQYREDVLAPCLGSISKSLLLEMGPLLLRTGGREFRRKWEQEADKREKIVRQMRQSSGADVADKIAQWEASVAEIREVLACLQEEKPSFN